MCVCVRSHVVAQLRPCFLFSAFANEEETRKGRVARRVCCVALGLTSVSTRLHVCFLIDVTAVFPFVRLLRPLFQRYLGDCLFRHTPRTPSNSPVFLMCCFLRPVFLLFTCSLCVALVFLSTLSSFHRLNQLLFSLTETFFYCFTFFFLFCLSSSLLHHLTFLSSFQILFCSPSRRFFLTSSLFFDCCFFF